MTSPAASSANASRNDVAVIASATVIDGAAKRQMRIVPFGEFGGRDGRGPWRLRDRSHAERVIAATRSWLNGVDLLVNYDHQTEYAAVPQVGGTARAAGWIKPETLTVGEDGIYGEAEWTEPAEAALNAREYRYYSPHFRADKVTGDLTKIVNIGLTNSPNIEVSALASQEAGASPAEGKTMERIAQLLSATALSALGLTAESEDEAAINAIDALIETNTESEAVLASVRTRFKLNDDAGEEAVLAAIDASVKAGEPDPSKFVPISALKDVQTQLNTINEERVLNAVDSAIEAGKLTPAQKDWAVRLGKKDLSELNSYLDTAPTFEGGKANVTGKPATKSNGLTEDESAICAMLGVTSDQYLETRKAEEEAA